MMREFEGKTEKEAIDSAIQTLSLDRDQFDVEILEEQKSSLFKKGRVVIRVHVPDEQQILSADPTPENDFEHAVIDFLHNLTEKMGFPAQAKILERLDNKIRIGLESDNSGMLIGRKGKNLDALQLLANIVAGRLDDGAVRVIVDSENYRARREENLVRLAMKVGKQVKKSRGSQLLEPMNPFERRLIHTTLNTVDDIDTKSEGEGLFKQVRVYYRGIDR